MAKLVIQLINDVARVVNADKRVGDRLKVVFLPNYRVSLAEIIIPGGRPVRADLHRRHRSLGHRQHEVRAQRRAHHRHLGRRQHRDRASRWALDNIFIFGNRTEQVAALRANGYQPRRYYDDNFDLKSAIDRLADGAFSPDEPGRYEDIVHSLLDSRPLPAAGRLRRLRGDAGARWTSCYRDPTDWTRRSILNVAGHGHVLVGPHHRRIRVGDLGGRSAGVQRDGTDCGLMPVAGGRRDPADGALCAASVLRRPEGASPFTSLHRAPRRPDPSTTLACVVFKTHERLKGRGCPPRGCAATDEEHQLFSR